MFWGWARELEWLQKVSGDQKCSCHGWESNRVGWAPIELYRCYIFNLCKFYAPGNLVFFSSNHLECKSSILTHRLFKDRLNPVAHGTQFTHWIQCRYTILFYWWLTSVSDICDLFVPVDSTLTIRMEAFQQRNISLFCLQECSSHHFVKPGAQ